MEQEKVEGLEQYCSKNEPNAGILIYALQHLGYKNDVALCDIIDNSIDAGATVIQLEITSDKILIIDNGCGMDEETLNEALRLGSDVVRDDASCLGKFGMGLSTASMSIANKTTVLTKTSKSDEVLRTCVNINAIKLKNDFVKDFGKATPKEKALYQEKVNEKSGTIVILEDCIGIKNRNVTQFSNKMKNEIARIYRKFMEKITFTVNGTVIKADDPLFLEDEKTLIYSDEDYEVKWKDKNGIERKSSIRAKLVLLPNFEDAKEKKINIPNQGFSILRNSREIAFGYMPSNWIIKHNSYNRFRGEISFQSDMDEAMGVDFKKNGIDMLDSVNDALMHALKPQIVSIGSQAKREKIKVENKSISHEEAEKYINIKSNVLIRPKEIITTECNSKKENEKKVNVKFETISSGRAGNIFSAYLEGKTTVIEWNIDHPFYESFVVSNKDNTKLISAVDYLIYSIATSQLKVLGDDNDKAEIIDQLISVMSNNMRALLS